MRIKLDENLPAELADDLQRLGHDVDSVASEGLAGSPDQIVDRAAKDAARVLFTLDKDFADIRHFPPRRSHGIVVFRFGSQGRKAIRLAVLDALRRLPARMEMGAHLTVVTTTTIRRRR